MGQEKFKNVAIEDYLAIEREDEVRYEYIEGELFAMAGGTLNHSEICNNIAGELYAQVKAKGNRCKSFNSEMKVEISPNNKYLYPDAGVSCPDHNESDHIKGAITNPMVVVEVLSPSSVLYDQITKLRYYFSLPSVKEYLIVYQDKPEVMLYRRHGNGDLFGLHAAEGIRSSIMLTSIEIELKLADIYYGIDFDDSE